MLGMFGGWLLDIGVVLQLNGIPYADNGFFKMPAIRVQHIGFYLSGGCLGALALLALRGR